MLSLCIGALCAAATLAFVVPLAMRGIILSDEGYLLQQSLDLLQGKVLYRDMDAFVTPGAWFLLAGLFALIEPSVLHSRIPIVVAYLLLSWLCYRIVAREGSRAHGFAVLLLLAVATVWAFPFWTFTFYSPLSVLCGLWALERLLAWAREQRAAQLLQVGTALGAAVLFKQNYGVFAACGVALGLLALRAEQPLAWLPRVQAWARDLGFVTAGGLAIGLPTFLYFAANGALGAIYQSLFVHPFEFMGQHDIPFLAFSELFAERPIGSGIERLTYAAPSAYTIATPARWVREAAAIERMHVLLYWFPVALFAVALGLSLRHAGRCVIDGPLAATLAVAAFVFLGVFPRADYNHLINVYQPVLVLTVLVALRLGARFPAPRPAWLRAAFALGVALALAYGAIGAYWYQVMWVRFSTPVPGPRGGVLVDFMDAQNMGFHVGQIQRRTKPGDAVLTVPDLAMYNFLADRPVPSPYYNLYQHHIGHDGGQAVVAGSRASGTKVALARFENFFSDRVGLRDYAPALAEHLRNDFDEVYTAFGDSLIFLERAAEPRPARASLDALADCSIPDESVVKLRHHLLFSSLYQEGWGGKGLQAAPLETRCRVQVPAQGGTLALQLGHRPPAGIEPGTSLIANVSAIDPLGATRTLLRRTIRVVPAPRPLPKAPSREAMRVDLSMYAGQEITLVFRSRLTGRIRQTPVNIRNFAMVWQDPHVEIGAPGPTRAAARTPASEGGE